MKINENFLPYKPCSIPEQIDCLCKLFPGIKNSHKKISDKELPMGAEGWYAVPRWEKIASTYNESVGTVLNLLKQRRKLYIHRYKLNSNYLSQKKRTSIAMKQLHSQQKDHDILIIPAQLGFYYRGRSVHSIKMNINEFGLDTFTIGVLLLTCQGRLLVHDDLYIYCAGDRYAPEGLSDWSDVPVFEFSTYGQIRPVKHQGRLKFNSVWAPYADRRYGAATGFLVAS